MIANYFAAAKPDSGHVDPFTYVLLELALVLFLAALGHWTAESQKQPSVLGELGIGMIFGNIGYWLGIPFSVLVMHLGDTGQVITEAIRSNTGIGQMAASLAEAGKLNPQLAEILSAPDAKRLIIMGFSLWLFSQLGILLLMFMAGLGTSVAEMKEVGGRALIVAIVGVAASFFAGYLGGRLVLPEASLGVPLFLGATLCATSVGISAKVFESLHFDKTREAKIVFGASVIDDVASIVVLAVVVGIVTTGEIDLWTVGKILLLASSFLGLLMLYGERFAAKAVRRFEVIESSSAKLFLPLILLFLFAWFASLLKLATITGAFGAGLVIRDRFFGTMSTVTIESLIRPLETVFSPIFFTLMGMQVNLTTLSEPSVALASLALIFAAMIGKAIAGYFAGPMNNRRIVALGMIPRGEEALLFAFIGTSLGVLDTGLFSAIVIMVMATALFAPLGLKKAIIRQGKP